MKNLYLFSTRFRVFWVQLPIIAVLVLSIIYNNESAGILRLYPLIIVSILGIIFIFVFFARFVRLSFAEVKCVGPFSSKDKAIVKKDRRLILRMLPHGKIKIYLRGYDGPCDFSWLKSEDEPKQENNSPENDELERCDICLFRGKAFGGKRTAKRILSYYGIDKSDFLDIFSTEGFRKKYEFVTLSTKTVDDSPELHLRFDETV